MKLKKIVSTKKFERDFGAARKKELVDPEEIAYLADELAAGRLLDPGYKDHELSFEWGGYREFHLAGDLLVIYKITKTKIIFVRMGTHSELF